MSDTSRPLLPHVGFWGRHKHRRLALHRNPGLELVYVTAGSPRWRIGDRVERVSPGQVFFSLPWETHGSELEREPGLEHWFVVVALDREYRRPPKRFAFHRDLHLPARETRRAATAIETAPRRVVAGSQTLRFLIPQIVGIERRGETTPEGRAALASLVRAAVLELARCCKHRVESFDVSEASERRVERFLRTLEQRCDEPWTLDAMAAACGLKRTRFSAHVHRLTGDSPIMALNRLRVRRAESALRETDLDVTRIALACGFQSSQYFARTFRAFTGHSPTAFRARDRRRASAEASSVGDVKRV